MKGYKGFDKGLVCRGKQYAENTVFEEEKAEVCKSGMHFCALPHRVFEYYSPGENHEFCEVEAIADALTDDESKYTTTKLKVGAKISVFDICKISVSAFFERCGFGDKIADVKKKKGAANAGDWGAANAGNRGAANAGNWGAANAGYKGAANAGDWGAANAGDWGAANAGNKGAANAGDWGAANAGDCGVAVVGIDGKSSCGENGVAVARGKNAMVKGGLRSVLILQTIDDEGNVDMVKSRTVDGKHIKPDVWYKLENGKFVEVKG